MGKQDRDRRYDIKRRTESATYGLYRTARWLKLRALQLRREPLCRMCMERGRFVPANTCDHVIAHKGDVTKFWEGPFQSLCSSCHNRDKQREESCSYGTEMGADGFPLDPRHPFNR